MTQATNDDQKNTQPTAPVAPKRKSPLMTGKVALILHTRLAQSLIRSKKQKNGFGLLDFGEKLRALWHSYKQNDPYAYWYFIKIDQMIEKIRHKISETENHSQYILSNIRGIKTEIFYNPQPRVYPLPYYIPFFHPAALLVADVDYMARQSHTMKQLGIFVELERLPETAIIPNMRELFSLPFEWKYTGVTRQDIEQKNEMAKIAAEKMGKLPELISKRKVTSVYLN